MMRYLALAFGLFFFNGIMVPELRAQDDLRASGENLAQALCGSCHAIGATQRSSHPVAPAFRDLQYRRDFARLEEQLRQGLVAGHPEMPVFVLRDHEAVALVRYLRSLQN